MELHARGHLIGMVMVGWLIDLGQPVIAFYIVAGFLGAISLLTRARKISLPT